jgi:hypothetical protein
MLEFYLIKFVINVCLFMPLRGKTMDQLNHTQEQRLINHYIKYMKTKKGQATPDMTVEDYLPILQKQAISYLMGALIILPFYLIIIAIWYM